MREDNHQIEHAPGVLNPRCADCHRHEFRDVHEFGMQAAFLHHGDMGRAAGIWALALRLFTRDRHMPTLGEAIQAARRLREDEGVAFRATIERGEG